MGEARRRGTFEERKAQAIAEGRIKRPKKSKREIERELLREILGIQSGSSLDFFVREVSKKTLDSERRLKGGENET